ncbi:hypothetical protein [Natronosalvus vescus]|uniref:hypothetical protein n=1 Tax=Natronosalvus vescus TaxID=2953881 RepID=UPI0020909D6D|nr:hypothetical protein [Natronosalvus vescus]
MGHIPNGAGVDVQVVSERCTVLPAIIDEHYDVRSEEDTIRQRQEVLCRSHSS